MDIGTVVSYRGHQATIINKDTNNLVTIQYADDSSVAIVGIDTLTLFVGIQPSIMTSIVGAMGALSNRIKGSNEPGSLGALAQYISNKGGSNSISSLADKVTEKSNTTG